MTIPKPITMAWGTECADRPGLDHVTTPGLWELRAKLAPLNAWTDRGVMGGFPKVNQGDRYHWMPQTLTPLGFQSALCQALVESSWAESAALLCLSFLIWKKGVILLAAC